MGPWRAALQHKVPHYEGNFWHQQPLIMVILSLSTPGHGAVPHLSSTKHSLGGIFPESYLTTLFPFQQHTHPKDTHSTL